MAVAPPAYARRIGGVIDAISHEDLVNKVALTLFPVSKYVQNVEDKLKTGARQSSVLETDHYCQELLYRYLRLCQRREWELSITRARYVESLLSSLPQLIEIEIRKSLRGKYPDIASIIEMAHHFEVEFHRFPRMEPTLRWHQ